MQLSVTDESFRTTCLRR